MEDVNKYIAGFSGDTQKRLESLRKLILTTVPDAAGSLSYGMPAYKINGKPLIYFTAYKKHIGVYALPNAHSHFIKQLSKYKQGKGSVQFPSDEELPFKLIEEILKFRLDELKGNQ